MADHGHPSQAGCCIKQLPEAVQELAGRNAKSIFGPNVPYYMGHPVTSLALAPGGSSDRAAIAVYTQRFWGAQPLVLTVSFLESPDVKLRARILEHMNAWKCSVRFEQAQAGKAGTVRISLRKGGFWSYLGTDILTVPPNEPTMNLEGFNIHTPDSEFRRVLRHETGHTLGFPHEHLLKEIVQRINPDAAYKWFWDTQHWNKQMVDDNVLTPVDPKTLLKATALDQMSVMCYQLPASIMKDHKAVPGGGDIDANDAQFCHALYPPPAPGAKFRTIADLKFEKPHVQTA